MAPRSGHPAHISAHQQRQQEHLRLSCRLGDQSEVALALKPQGRTWWKLAKRLLSYFSAGGSGSEEPADLSHVYDDDMGNMAIHYIALGGKPTLTSTVMALFCMRPTAALADAKRDAKRAELLRWLMDSSYALDLSAVNARLQTPAHCAVQSRSLGVLEVLLTYMPANRAQRLPACIAAQDSEGMRPLDLALATQQWPAVRLLISTGALQACPELAQAQRELQQLLPGGRRPSGAFELLKGALGKAMSLVWKQGSASAKPPPRQSSAGPDRLPGTSAPQAGRGEEAAECKVIVLGSPQEIYQHRQASIQTLMQRSDVEEHSSLQKLEAHQWNIVAALGTLEQTPPADDSQGANTGHAAKRTLQPEPGNCGTAPVLQPCAVCYEETLPSSASIPCQHHTCDECLKGILLASMDEGDLGRSACPVPNCRSSIPEQAAQQLLSSRQLERYRQLAAQTYADRSPLMQWCPRPGCGQCVALDLPGGCPDSAAAAASGGRAEDVQCACGQRFCLCCGMDPHEPAPCAAVRDWNEMLRRAKKLAASESESWVTKNTKPCMGCGARIQKNGGCNHITCTRCLGHFCWVCGRDWKEHTPATGGFWSCNRFAPEASAGGAAEGPAGLRALIDSLYGLYGRVQDAAQQYRLEHYLRRYHAQECDPRLLHLAADWMAALLSAGVPATGYHTAALGLKQLLQPAEADQAACAVRRLPVVPDHDGSYSYLSQAAAEVVAGRRVLANSYVAAYSMPESDRKRRFEDAQGRLEAAVEQSSLPLALMPHIQALSEAAAQHAKTDGGDVRLTRSLNRMPLDISDGEIIRQQAYHALALHSMAEQIRNITAVVVTERSALLRMAREGQ